MAPGLVGYEFVGHVFVVARGPSAPAAYQHLRALWSALPALQITDRLGARPPDPPAELPAADGLLAARAGPGPSLREAVLRRTQDVVCLSVMLSSLPSGNPSWDSREADWDAVFTPPAEGYLGSARILQARLDDPASLLDVALLDPVIRGSSAVPPDWWRPGVLRSEAPLGPFAVWEAVDPAAGQLDRDGRSDRRLTVVADNHRDAQLSAWTWTYGTQLPSLGHYLLHAAKMRHQLRLWIADRTGSDLRSATDRAIAPLLDLANTTAGTGKDPDPATLLEAAVPLVMVQARESGLVDRASRLRELSRTVDSTARTMAAYAQDDLASGLFADDKGVADWFVRQLDHEAGVLDSVADRARSVAGLGDQLMRRVVVGRQERFNLALSGVVGAVLMALAVIQSFQYDVPIDNSVKGPATALLGAFALLATMIVLRTAAPRRRGSAVAVGTASAVFGASVGWLAVAVVQLRAPLVAGFAPAAGALFALIGVVAAWRAMRRG